MLITINLESMIYGMLLPFWVFLCFAIALAIGKRFETFSVGRYVDRTVKKNNELIKENMELRRKLDPKDLL